MTNNKDTIQVALKSPSGFLAFGFGSGLVPVAPGTFGSLAAIPIYLLMANLPWQWYLIITIAAFILGIFICERASQNLGVHDHGGIVWDEFVGMWITLFMIPNDWYWLLTGFLLFRFFDIIKPFPIKWLDKKVKGGFGIMIDDVIAGIFAWLVLIILMRFI